MPKFSLEYLRTLEYNHYLSEKEVEEWLMSCKPEWAHSINKFGKLKKGTQLLTRDGRAIGNAYITDKESKSVVYVVRTDAGNICKFSATEIYKLFHIGIYILKDEGTK